MKSVGHMNEEIEKKQQELDAMKDKQLEAKNSGIRFGHSVHDGGLTFSVNGEAISYDHGSIEKADFLPGQKVNDTAHLPDLKKMLELVKYISRFADPLRSTIEKIEKGDPFESEFKEESK